MSTASERSARFEKVSESLKALGPVSVLLAEREAHEKFIRESIKDEKVLAVVLGDAKVTKEKYATDVITLRKAILYNLGKVVEEFAEDFTVDQFNKFVENMRKVLTVSEIPAK